MHSPSAPASARHVLHVVQVDDDELRAEPANGVVLPSGMCSWRCQDEAADENGGTEHRRMAQGHERKARASQHAEHHPGCHDIESTDPKPKWLSCSLPVPSTFIS